MTFNEFFAVRIVRLYPLLIAGMALGAAQNGVRLFSTHQFDALEFFEAAFWAMLVLPFGHIGTLPLAFPFNAPAWSLFYELLINFVYALLIGILSTQRLVAVAVISGIAIVLTALHYGHLNLGGQLVDFLPGLIRVTFSFSIGVLLGRQSRLGWVAKLPPVSPVWIVVALFAIFLIPATPLEPAFQALCVVALFPALLLLGTTREPSSRFISAARLSGRLSYPLYILHFPINRVFLAIIEGHQLAGAGLVAMIGIEFITVIALSYISLVIYDEPIRKALGKKGLIADDRPSSAPSR
jgi:peptidoglycan/LPS O-acetylase OafA/YrhL